MKRICIEGTEAGKLIIKLLNLLKVKLMIVDDDKPFTGTSTDYQFYTVDFAQDSQ